MHACMYVRTYARLFNVHVCLTLSLYMCVYVCMYTYIRMIVCIYIYLFIHILLRIHRIYIYRYIYIYIDTFSESMRPADLRRSTVKHKMDWKIRCWKLLQLLAVQASRKAGIKAVEDRVVRSLAFFWSKVEAAGWRTWPQLVLHAVRIGISDRSYMVDHEARTALCSGRLLLYCSMRKI